jgi:hypothetical protein
MAGFSAISLAIFSAILGALSAYLVRRRFDRVAATVKQFEFYHSDKMLAARTLAWDYLTSEEFTKDPKPLEYYYAGPGIAKNKEYAAIIQVLYFWYLLSILHENGEIVSKLASKLLSYQYGHWKAGLKPLLDATAHGKDQPECLAIRDRDGKPGSMAWIEA